MELLKVNFLNLKTNFIIQNKMNLEKLKEVLNLQDQIILNNKKNKYMCQIHLLINIKECIKYKSHKVQILMNKFS